MDKQQRRNYDYALLTDSGKNQWKIFYSKSFFDTFFFTSNGFSVRYDTFEYSFEYFWVHFRYFWVQFQNTFYTNAITLSKLNKRRMQFYLIQNKVLNTNRKRIIQLQN